MANVPIITSGGASAGEYEVDDQLLELTRGEQAVHEVIVAYGAAQRGGNASTRNRAEIRGSGAKPWRQKGTGRARAGSRKSPLWRGGGVIFGPTPRSYRKKVPKKQARLAFRRALSERVTNGAIRIIDELSVPDPKTKHIASMLSSLQASGYVLLVVKNADRNVYLSARNIAGLELVEARNLNCYQILRYPTIIATREAMDELIAQRLGPVQRGGQQ